MKPKIVSLGTLTDWVHWVCQLFASTPSILKPGSKCLLFSHILGSRTSGRVLLEGFAEENLLLHALPDAFRKLLENPWGRKFRIWFVFKACFQGEKGETLEKRVFLCFRRNGSNFSVSGFVWGDADFPTLPKALRAKANSLIRSDV